MTETSQRTGFPLRPAGGPGTSEDAASAESPARGWTEEARIRRILWLTVCCLSLAALAFLDRPGKIVADTKLDLAVNPAGFLAHALHLWEPAQFGQLADQAYGYLFPMGPFFLLGKLMGLAPWEVQRLWIAAVAIAAFLGVVKLSARLGIANPVAQVVAGFGYALAPRGLTLLGTLSAEFLPAAMLPWIILPLLRAVQEGESLGTRGRIRQVARSAVAVALCSGMNAASVVAMLAAAAIFLLAMPRSAAKWRVIAWWLPAVGIATFWWIYPLYLLGKYGVSFLPYTESAQITTSVTSLSNTLRGTEDWVSYLVVDGSPWWPVGFALSTSVVATLVTGLLAGLGLTGLFSRNVPARRSLLWMLALGVLVIGTGYVSGLGNPIASPLHDILNGPLAPLRNLRKFDPLVRLPIAIGLAYLLGSMRLPTSRRVASGVVAAARAIVASPAVVGGLSPAGDFTAIPSYWQRAAAWLNQHAGNQAVLEVPGARFGEYVWGRPMDDVLQPLVHGDWAARQLGAIGSVGNVRLLDAINQEIAAGQGSPGLVRVLARMGVKYLVVRNDLLRSDLHGAWPARIHQALLESPGIVKVAQFGSFVGNVFSNDAVSGVDALYPPVEIYRVGGAEPVVTAQPVAGTLRVYGGPEALLTLASDGLLGRQPVLLNSDSPSLPASESIVTDSLRRRAVNFSQLLVDYSPTLTRTQSVPDFGATADYLEPGWRRYLSVARYSGVTSVTASSSAADITAPDAQSATGRLPYAAISGDFRQMWESGSWTGPIGQWIQARFAQPVEPAVISAAFADNAFIGPPVTKVTVSTSAGSLRERVKPTGDVQLLRVPPGPTSWLRITVTGTKWTGGAGTQVGISAISVPGVTPSRTIVAPDVRLPGGSDPSAFVLAKAEPTPGGCMLTSVRWVCSPLLGKVTEEQFGFSHAFTAARDQRMTLTGTAVLTDPATIERYAWPGSGQAKVSASSTFTPDPQDQPQSAFDTDPSTTWIAGPADKTPWLRIRWSKRTTVSQVTITRPSGAAAPLWVRVAGAGQDRSGWITGTTGTLKITPIRTSSLVLTFRPSTLPLQIGEVRIPGVAPLRSGGGLPLRIRCGFGPVIDFNGAVIPTRAYGTFSALLTGQPLHFAACRKTSVRAGTNLVTEPNLDPFDIQAMALTRPGLTASRPAVAGGASAAVLSWGPSRRLVRVRTAAPSFLVMNENYNAGWQAVMGDHVLQPVRLDGWRQAWLLPRATSGTVALTFTPDAGYRRSLFGGLFLLALTMIVAVMPVRRRIAPAPRHAAVKVTVRQLARPGPQLRGRLGWAAAMVLCAGAGIWTGGYPGALLVPVAVAGFVVALAARHGPVTAMVRSPWVATVLVLMAATLQAIGDHLARTEPSASVTVMFSDAGPQLLGLLVLARVLAGLARGEPDTDGDRGGATQDGTGRIGPATVDPRSVPVELVEPLCGPLDEVVAKRRHDDRDDRGRDQQDD